MNTKLTREDIRHMDTWLKNKGLKYMDIRYELIDHLVEEYQQLKYAPDLESFLLKRLIWCKKVDKQKQKAVNLGMTKELFNRFFRVMTHPLWLCLLLFVVLGLFWLSTIIPIKFFRKAYFGLYLLPIAYQIYLMFFSGLGSKIKKQAISAVYLVNIFTIPQLPLYFIGLIPDGLAHNPNFYIPVFSVGIVLNIVAILFFYEKRSALRVEFELLNSQFS